MDYIFKVKVLEAGQKRRYGDSYYSYEVTSNRDESEVKSFCMNVLRKSYEREKMPHPFAGELREFTKITKNTPEDADFFSERLEETYLYKVQEQFTD